MSLALLFPPGLVALAAWLIPALLHLRRRSEHQRTAFAALQWLDARAWPRRRPRIEDWPLLLVRLLLLAALALLLARPVLHGVAGPAEWLVFAPGVDPAAVPAMDARTERRWLTPGFPDIARPAPRAPVAVGSLVRELDAMLPPTTRITVVVPSRLDGADASVPVLSRNVGWRIVSGLSPAPATAKTPSRPLLTIRTPDDRDRALRYFRAAATAWRALGPSADAKRPLDVGLLADPLPAVQRPLVWLGAGTLPPHLRDWIGRGGVALVGPRAEAAELAAALPLLHDARQEVLARGVRIGAGRLLQWTRPFTPEASPILLEPEFPERLWQLFAPPAPAPGRVAAADYAPRAGAAAFPQRPRDLQPWLLGMIAGLFLVERWMAGGRRTAGATA